MVRGSRGPARRSRRVGIGSTAPATIGKILGVGRSEPHRGSCLDRAVGQAAAGLGFQAAGELGLLPIVESRCMGESRLTSLISAPRDVKGALLVDPPVGVGPEQILAGPGSGWRARVRAGSRRSRPARSSRRASGCRARRLARTPPPRILGFLERGGEELGEHQVGKLGFTVVGLADAVEEAGPDDAAAPPDRRHRAQVDAPGLRL